MMKMFGRFMMRVGLCVIITIYIAIALGCSSPTSRLIGKWSDNKNQDSFEFFKDNTCILQSTLMSISGKWTVFDDARIKIDIESFGVTQSIMGKMEGENLIFYMGDKKTTLHKVKAERH